MCYDVDFWFFSVMSSRASFPEEDDDKKTLKLKIMVRVHFERYVCSFSKQNKFNLAEVFMVTCNFLGLQTASLLKTLTADIYG